MNNWTPRLTRGVAYICAGALGTQLAPLIAQALYDFPLWATLLEGAIMVVGVGFVCRGVYLAATRYRNEKK